MLPPCVHAPTRSQRCYCAIEETAANIPAFAALVFAIAGLSISREAEGTLRGAGDRQQISAVHRCRPGATSDRKGAHPARPSPPCRQAQERPLPGCRLKQLTSQSLAQILRRPFDRQMSNPGQENDGSDAQCARGIHVEAQLRADRQSHPGKRDMQKVKRITDTANPTEKL